MFSGDFRLLEFYQVPNTFFPISTSSLFRTGGCDMCVHSRRECVPSLQEIDSHQAEMISTPIRMLPPPNISLLYRLDNTHSDWLPFLTRTSIIEFSGWIGPASANNNLPNPIALIIHKVKMWWNKLDNKRSLSYYICFGGYWCILYSGGRGNIAPGPDLAL